MANSPDPEFQQLRDDYDTACMNGDLKFLQNLFEDGYTFESMPHEDAYRGFALAGGEGHTDIIEFLLEKRYVESYPEHWNNYSRTINEACVEKKFKIAKLLIPLQDFDLINRREDRQFHANPYDLDSDEIDNFNDEYDFYGFHYCCQYGHLDLIKLFLKHGFDPTHTWNSYGLNGHGFVNDHYLFYERRLTGFQCACFFGNENVVKFFIHEVKDFDIFSTTSTDGNTALHLACMSGNVNLVKFFLDFGFAINALNQNGENPFFVACRYANRGIVRFLVTQDADIYCRQKNGSTAFHEICLNESLLEEGDGQYHHDIYMVYTSWTAGYVLSLDEHFYLNTKAKARRHYLGGKTLSGLDCVHLLNRNVWCKCKDVDVTWSIFLIERGETEHIKGLDTLEDVLHQSFYGRGKWEDFHCLDFTEGLLSGIDYRLRKLQNTKLSIFSTCEDIVGQTILDFLFPDFNQRSLNLKTFLEKYQKTSSLRKRKRSWGF